MVTVTAVHAPWKLGHTSIFLRHGTAVSPPFHLRVTAAKPITVHQPPSWYNPCFMFRGLEHTAIPSPNPGLLAAWYVDKLDFRINYMYDGNYFLRAADGSILEIIPSEGGRATQRMKDPGI